MSAYTSKGKRRSRASYKLLADGYIVWSGEAPPTQSQIDRAGYAADARGWNGLTLDLTRDGEWLRFVYPRED